MSVHSQGQRQETPAGHPDGKVYADPSTGKLKIYLVRDDCDPELLEEFDGSGFWVEQMEPRQPRRQAGSMRRWRIGSSTMTAILRLSSRHPGIRFLFELANSQQAKLANAVSMVIAAGGTNGRTLTAAEVTFTASGGAWSLAKIKFLATTTDDSGKLISTEPINAGSGIALSNGESYDVTMTLAAEP